MGGKVGAEVVGGGWKALIPGEMIVRVAQWESMVLFPYAGIKQRRVNRQER